MNKIVRLALAARTVSDLDSLEKALRQSGATRTRYLGDRPANWSTLSNAADPKGLVFERAINMPDALLDREVMRRKPDLTRLASPRQAAHVLGFTTSNGIAELTESERRTIARQEVIRLLDSDDSVRRPTFAFRDHGIGVSRREAPGTILSLEGSNKLSKSWLHGVFGKGGNLATIYSDGVVFVLRKQPDLLDSGDEDEVTVAVVRREDDPNYRLPFFRYLVCDSNVDKEGLPWACTASEAADFEPGAYVAHINYHADKMGQQNWNNEESIYAFAETLLFRPTLPYGLEDDRTPPANRRPEGRGMSVLWGLGHRLDDLEVARVVAGPPDPSAKMPPLLRRSEYSTVTIPGVGNARVRWWLFESRDKRRQNVAHGFVSIFTHDGQVHHAWDQTRFVGLVPNRARVAQRVFVEVDLEGIPRRQRIQILSSIREALRKTPEARKLEEKVADWLGKDADLEEAEAHFIREALRNAQQQVSKDFLDKLNRAIAAKIPSIEVLIDRKGGAGKVKKPKPKPQEELLPEPTAFTGPESITIVPGETHVFYMSVNAENGFIPTKGQIELAQSPREAELSLSAVGDLRSGRVQLSISAGDNAALGRHHAILALSWLRSSGGANELRWPLNISVLSERQQAQVKPPSKESGLAKEGKKRSQVALVWHRLEDEKDNGWTVDTAGDLQKMSGEALAGADPELYGNLKDVAGDIPTIVLNEDHSLWKTYEAAALLKSDLARKVRRDRYALAIGVAVANLWVREEAIASAYENWLTRGNGGDEPPKAMMPDQRRRALSDAARGILTVLPDFDRLALDADVAATA